MDIGSGSDVVDQPLFHPQSVLSVSRDSGVGEGIITIAHKASNSEAGVCLPFTVSGSVMFASCKTGRCSSRRVLGWAVWLVFSLQEKCVIEGGCAKIMF